MLTVILHERPLHMSDQINTYREVCNGIQDIAQRPPPTGTPLVFHSCHRAIQAAEPVFAVADGGAGVVARRASRDSIPKAIVEPTVPVTTGPATRTAFERDRCNEFHIYLLLLLYLSRRHMRRDAVLVRVLLRWRCAGARISIC